MPPLHPHTPPALATYLNGAREWTPLHVAADARDVAALRALLRDARVGPRLAVRAALPDMRTALSIAGSASYPMARPVDKAALELRMPAQLAALRERVGQDRLPLLSLLGRHHLLGRRGSHGRCVLADRRRCR